MIKKLIPLFFCSILFFGSSSAQDTPLGAIGFYNLENLFDTEDDPEIRDEEYLPSGRNEWSEERYSAKVNNMSRVIADMAKGVDILGLAEIENRKVLEDLVQHKNLAAKKYQIIHFDSPDFRGIDVALIYRQSRFQPFKVNSIPFPKTAESNFRTRDILWVKGLYLGDTIHVAVNHWPSRRGGKSDKRIEAAGLLKKHVDSVLNINPKAKIVLMGDFNDDPSDKSVKKALMASHKVDKDDPTTLYNCSSPTFKQGFGTLFFRGAWNLFDQIIISQSLLEENRSKYYYMDKSFSIFAPDYMRVQSGESRGAPFRTFSFGVYQNGFSDHFPVYIILAKKK